MIRRYKNNEIDELAKILNKDGVISVPTDTVYGLCACANSIKAYNNLVIVKNRPKNKLFPIMCANTEQINSIAVLDEKTKKLIQTFMPGPLTLILKKKAKIPAYVNNGSTTIAVRMATSKVLEDLIKKANSPIFMTSANKSGEPTCINLDEIEKSCPLLDGILVGSVSFGKESTIIDCTLEEIQILRLGPISKKQIIESIKKMNVKIKD